jgi:hypothetical protein
LALSYDVLIIRVETQGKGQPLAGRMDIKQSARVFGNRCTLCDE